MATWNSNQITANGGLTTAAQLKTFAGQMTPNCTAFYFEITSTAAFNSADVLNFGVVPKGFRLLYACLESTDIDTNGSPTVTINVGDSGSATRIFSGSTIGQAGGITNTQTTTGHGFQFTDDTVIVGAFGAGPATGAIGTIALTLIGTFQGLAS